MTNEEKELLLKDISARLPYGIKCQVQEDEYTYIGTLCRLEVDNKNGNLLDFVESISGLDCQVYLSEAKPYLFPLESMTEEQKEEYCVLQQKVIYNSKGPVNLDVMEYINWCYKNHIDINNLIPMGLANDATNLGIYE